ncbi:unnamed protein product [Cercopithifilaria johnstoni]|uniref:Uncharacterized protein n=1 Tax=Cercopithifilaria johnstoni TaxID=2874296 RepID=A0A8J2M7H8_9BILA|nr:unnamed protein product [Cercopithifilaria johnstoni]
MKLLEQKQKELQRISSEIQRLSQGNPQQQRKCVRLKEDHEKLEQEIQKLQENKNKDEKRLDELRKEIETNEGNDESQKRKRKKLEDFQKEYKELREKLGVGEELKEDAERVDNPSENTSSFKTDENIYLNKQHPEVKLIQKDQYGVDEQVKNIKTVEERMLKRKKIELEAEETFNIGMASLCELEANIDNMTKRVASPVIQKFEEELKLIRNKSNKDTKVLKTKIVKLEVRINQVERMREICVTAIAELNLTTKRMLFDLMAIVVNILRNALYMIAWIRDSLVNYTESR